MKKRWLIRFVSLAIIAVLFFVVLPGSLQAARSYNAPAQPSGEISEDDRPWPGTPWLISIVLSAGAVAVGLKNARRTHLD